MNSSAWVATTTWRGWTSKAAVPLERALGALEKSGERASDLVGPLSAPTLQCIEHEPRLLAQGVGFVAFHRG